jgi:acetyltransferase-like isoleucine patch superfamily enzyme
VFVHPLGLVEPGARIGAGTRVWAFAHILPDARIGRDCNICDHVFIEGGVVLGDRVTVKCGVQLWTGLEVEDDVFIGPNATFTNDPFPRSKRPPAAFSTTRIRSGASISANATILPGVTIGRNAMVGAGAVVTHSVPPNAIVVGNPASIKDYVGAKAAAPALQAPSGAAAPTGVRGVAVHRLPCFGDLRGQLAVAELGVAMPFRPSRVWATFDVPTREVRGESAHRRLEQFFVCFRGSCRLLVDDGHQRREIALDEPTLGIHVGPMVWCSLFGFSSDALLVGLASDPYDPDDYIRSYEDFLALRPSSTDVL